MGERSILVACLLLGTTIATGGPASASPATVVFVDTPSCDPLSVPNAVDELGTAPGFANLLDELISAVDTISDQPPCPTTDSGDMLDVLVRITNTTGRSFSDLWYVADPAIAASNDILRACVHCGFCTATCPTYRLLGDELDGPRGRIYLIKEMLEQDRPPSTTDVRHVDRCLSCLSCMTTCPSGVHYMHLVDHARNHIEATHRRPWKDRILRDLLGRILPGARIMRPFNTDFHSAAQAAAFQNITHHRPPRRHRQGYSNPE